MAIKLPDGFKRYETLLFCGNVLENVDCILEIDSTPILLVGTGSKKPSIWVSAAEYVAGSTGLVWVYAVNQNRTVDTRVSVEFDENSTTVKMQDSVIVRAVEEKPNTCIVVEADLRPLGIEIHGNIDGLALGRSLMKNNRFKNVISMIGLAKTTVVGYNIYSSTDRDQPLHLWKRLNSHPIPNTHYKMTNLEPSTTYYSYVTAINAAGIESSPSEIREATTFGKNERELSVGMPELKT